MNIKEELEVSIRGVRCDQHIESLVPQQFSVTPAELFYNTGTSP